MQCTIYKSGKKEGMYLYLREKDDFSAIPPLLLAQLGQLTLVMELNLSTRDKLARADIEQVKAQLREQGFYLQMPPKDPWLQG
ncbi:YcgL domain-containing protein [Pasteurellaceae bacterium HPA106]|uniref:YcgL domain-containing protein n=1 Tax=Spirabiliibacterium pneumoniae TaxID=221400 RepID=UPI001AACD94D|nr:YcgL domain-containing protein [Spirabiliibacterium pneumoniae]MBE2896608.1 YcgL domain-containing protein [Spirabiliibacterium pneumoniae]